MNRVHPLISGAAAHFENGRAIDEGSYLKPYKRMLVDVTAAEATLKAALDLASDLFNTLEAAGHRVVLAPTNLQLRRMSAEEREPVGKAREYWDHSGLWSPDRATVVFIGTVAVGLQVVEMSESVNLRYVRGKYVREADYVAPKRGYQDYTFTTTRALPSGRLRVIAYSPYSQVEWSARWQDAANARVRTSIRTIVAAIIAKAPDLAVKLEEADRQRQIRHQEWLVQKDRRQREDDHRRIADSVLESTTDLRNVIERWADMTNVGRFLDGVEQSASALPEDEKKAILQRLALARAFLGKQDPLDFFRSWQTPGERYAPRFSEGLAGL